MTATGGSGAPAGGGGRQLAVFVAKLVISGALIAFVLARISFTEIQAAMRTPRWGWLLAALGVYGVSALGGAQQWAWILRVTGVTTPVREIRRLYFIGLFFNNFLPANIGGDAYKIIDLGRRENRPHAVFCATLMDRLIGLGALTALAVLVMAGCALAGVPLPRTALLMIPVLLFLFGVLALLLSRRLGARLPGLLRAIGLVRLAEQAAQVTHEFGAFRRRVAFMNGVLAFSIVVQALRMATHLLVALGLGFALAPVQVAQLLVLVPMLAISLTLPVTINGIGLRESVSAELLTAAGLGATAAVAMEVAAYLVQVVFSLQGGVLLWLGRWGRLGRNGNS
ncbi:flippase-like domain-containing protein [bacterium]|nr:flippase-like domain-containing protein [bacterium]